MDEVLLNNVDQEKIKDSKESEQDAKMMDETEENKNDGALPTVLLTKEVEQILDREVPKKEMAREIVTFVQSTWVGPIPPPSILQGYSEVLKNGGERVFALTEDQSKHRREMESKIVKANISDVKRGQIFAFILAFIMLGLVTLFTFFGYSAIAGIFGTTTIVGLVAVFIVGRKGSKK